MLLALDQELTVAASAALQQRGCVHIIGLGEIKRQVGERWERRREMVWGRLDNLLRQQLGPTDFHVRINELCFLVSMPSVSQNEAEIFCLRVAHELHTGLLGSCQPGDIEVSRSVNFHDNAIETVAVGIEAAQAALALDRPAAAKPASRELLVPQIGAERSATIRGVEIFHRFTPIWDARKEAVASYRCVSLYDQTLTENFGIEQRTKFELALTLTRIRHGTGALSQGLTSGRKFLLWVPVSYEVLGSSAARAEITALCRKLAADLFGYIVFEISDLPYGVPQSRLFDLINALKPWCRGIVAQLPARIASYGAYLGSGLQAIGVSLLAGGVSGTEMESELFKLCATARRQHIMSFVFDIPSEDLLQSARDLGVNLLSGPLIGAPVEIPAAARRLAAKDIAKLAPHKNAA
jgi:hypothetical protein